MRKAGLGTILVIGLWLLNASSVMAEGFVLESFARKSAIASDIVFSLFYAAIFIVCVVTRILKRRKRKAEGEEIRKTDGIVLLIIGFAFGVLAMLEATNLISTPEIITSLGKLIVLR